MSEVILISNARLSFPNLAEPQTQVDPNTGNTRVSYNCELILPPNHPGMAEFLRIYGALALEQWKGTAQQVMQMIQNDRRLRCYGVGEEKIDKKTFQPYDGYVGNQYITTGSKNPPQMIQADGNPVDPANTMAYQALARKLYGGCWVNAAIKPWLQDNKHGRGVRCDLIAIQFNRDDAPFGEGAPDVTGMFGSVAQQGGAPAAPPGMPMPPFMAQPPAAPAAPQMPLPPFMMK